MNIVLTSVGRRSYLVRYFQEALAGCGYVVATNSVAGTPGMVAADAAHVVPSGADPQFVDELLAVCRQHEARLLFSLHDWEAPFISRSAARFREVGTLPVVSPPPIIDLCLDKHATWHFAQAAGIHAPVTFASLDAAKHALASGELTFPLIIKPRFGQGSIGLHTVCNIDELECAYSLLQSSVNRLGGINTATPEPAGNVLIQEMVSGVEYGLDVVNNLKGEFVTCLAKRKLGMRAGETDAAETVRDSMLEEFGARLGRSLCHIGVLDVDVMVRDDVPYLLEMNPRFGGHYPFSHVAGANIPAALIAWARGQEADLSWLRVRAGVRAYKDMVLCVGS